VPVFKNSLSVSVLKGVLRPKRLMTSYEAVQKRPVESAAAGQLAVVYPWLAFHLSAGLPPAAA